MKFYNCKVRLAGSLHNEVLKTKISAPEVIILREKHGNDAIVDLTEVAKDHLDNLKERERLTEEYGLIVEKLFGGPHMNLPQAIFASADFENGEEPKKTKEKAA